MILFSNIKIAEGTPELLANLRERIDEQVNLPKWFEQKPVTISQNMLLRISFIAGLSLSETRNEQEVAEVKASSSAGTMHDTVFNRSNLSPLWSAVLKLRYQNSALDIENPAVVKKIINYEVKRGAEYLLKGDNLINWLNTHVNQGGANSYGNIPKLNLHIGSYEDELDAFLDLNSTSITNTQILIAGTTGSGKSNTLAVLIHEIRSVSIDTSYPVNFLLFDYKGEFSDPANNDWLQHFEVDRTSILDPLKASLPFNPFKDFRGRTQNEINLYSTELANALMAIDSARISANMNNRLSEAIIKAYKQSSNLPINFEQILNAYNSLRPDKKQDEDDSISSVLKQLIRSNLFSNEDKIDLIKESLIIKMDGFPKEGPIAKAIVYFIISKLNTLYEKLPKQAVENGLVELRHFTIIDEAHYMLGFDNKPLRDLIAVGRNKGLSIILATQNMDSYKSEYFDFYANAQYPLIMKQQSINDGVIKDLFGVSGNEFQEIKTAISGLQKGEILLKNPMAIELGMGKKYKKIKVSHLI
ncbi:MAG: ATP-binding protein [Chitinophagaceae bacterium]|nr:MAG: ATP-binding protein [Chitinophagaceae bacterium]